MCLGLHHMYFEEENISGPFQEILHDHRIANFSNDEDPNVQSDDDVVIEDESEGDDDND